jgi:predicted nucleotidyltransferase
MRDMGENIYRVSETERLEVTEKITAHLKGYDDVVFAYLFGSFIDQELGYFRDIDIAVFIIDTKGGSTMAREITLANAIQEAIDYQYPVDVVVMNDKDLTLIAEIIEGDLLFTKDKDLWADYVVDKVIRYNDMAYYRDLSIKEAYLES